MMIIFSDVQGYEKMVADTPDVENKQMNLYEADIFLGINPASTDSSEIKLSESITTRLIAWISKGLTDKDEKENLF